jgi:hypothetical protein
VAVPFFKVKGSGQILTDWVSDYTYWNMPWGKVVHTPISGGAYPQNTMAGTLRMGVVLTFQADHPTAPLDNFFTLFELERADPQTLYQLQDVQGWIRDVHLARSPFGDVGESGGDLVQMRMQEMRMRDHIELPVDLIVPGYLPATLGP